MIIDGRAGAVRSLLIAAKDGIDRRESALSTAVRFGREIIELADNDSLDIGRSRIIEQEVLDILDAPKTR